MSIPTFSGVPLSSLDIFIPVDRVTHCNIVTLLPTTSTITDDLPCKSKELRKLGERSFLRSERISQHDTVKSCVTHEDLIEERRVFFDQLYQARQERMILETAASVRIQAWSRGFLVREKKKKDRNTDLFATRIVKRTKNQTYRKQNSRRDVETEKHDGYCEKGSDSNAILEQSMHELGEVRKELYQSHKLLNQKSALHHSAVQENISTQFIHAYLKDLSESKMGNQLKIKRRVSRTRKHIEELAAIQIQSYIRAIMAKRAAEREHHRLWLEYRSECATKIQAHFRRFLTMKKINEIKRSKKESAAMLVQRSVRGMKR